MQSILGGLLILGVLTITLLNGQPTPVEAESNIPQTPQEPLQPIKTQSRFEEKLSETSEVIEKKTIYQDDQETEAGIETVLEEGEDGKKIKIIKTTLYEGQEYSKEIIGTEITPAKDKVISRGTKVIWKTLDTADGEIKYWKKLRVYATHYDSRCPGGNEWTSIGMGGGQNLWIYIYSKNLKVWTIFLKGSKSLSRSAGLPNSNTDNLITGDVLSSLIK